MAFEHHSGYPVASVYIIPVLLYGVETWTVTLAMQKKLNAFD